jgi:hypothetical protein
MFGADDFLDLLRFVAPKLFKQFSQRYSYGILPSNKHHEKQQNGRNEQLQQRQQQGEEDEDVRHWTNVLQSPLPLAPNMTIYNFHGVGIQAERGYIYRPNPVLLLCVLVICVCFFFFYEFAIYCSW